MLKRKKEKKISPTLEFMRKMREKEWEQIQADEEGFRKLEGNEPKKDS